MADLKTYRIVSLGLSGSGKTVYLASMADKLATQAPETGFYVLADNHGIRMELANKYSEIIDPSKDWPPGTRRAQGEEIVFTCSIHSKGTNYPVFKFSYLEYAGEKLEPGRTDPRAAYSAGFSASAILEKARQADAVLILIDGLKVLQLMEGNPEPLRRDFAFLLPVVMELGSKPFHFVISKWDIVKPKYEFRLVRERLLANYEHFRNLVHHRRGDNIPTRLIPMSSVGFNFAEVVDGHMIKKPMGLASPSLVEVPIACTLFDAFKLAKEQYAAEFRVQRGVIGWGRTVLRVLRIIRVGSEFAQFIAPGLGIAASVVSTLLELGEAPLAHRLHEIANGASKRQSTIHDATSAVESVIWSYALLIARLETEYPESDLLRV